MHSEWVDEQVSACIRASSIKQMKINRAAGIMARQSGLKPSLTSTAGIWRDNQGSMRLDHYSGLQHVSVR